MVKKLNKKKRQLQLLKLIDTNPFVTDEELAKYFAVSIQTIRLDRLALDIPELRMRTMQVAEQAHQQVKSMVAHEMVGKLIELQLGQFATSVLEVGLEMVAEKSQVCRGDYLFSQANALAAALIDAEIVLTGSARLRFRRPVYLNEKIIAHAFLARKKINKYLIKVVSKVETEEVFMGKFVFVAKQEVNR
ncbi:MAG: transcription factor FapR [Clostridia bacterium]|nr:transcription factor FapR [Clostridia bacterium]MDD4145998.1 transcription factor FapR [Clostridia bacterium]MDD4665931.1 transcription factor FapR [Clostridia bacterium]